MNKETRNSKVLESFVAYCILNPEERFWQALRNWSEIGAIFAIPWCEDEKCISMYHGEDGKDTFSWEGKNK